MTSEQKPPDPLDGLETSGELWHVAPPTAEYTPPAPAKHRRPLLAIVVAVVAVVAVGLVVYFLVT
jgi:hypothetical protein